MNEYLVVDGYNIINAWPDLKKLKDENIEHARVKLAEILVNYYGVTKVNILLVFDANLVKGGQEKREILPGVEVIYTREGETADMFIERTTGEIASRAKVFVATSDWIEQSIILQKGAWRISARELYEEILGTLAKNYDMIKKDKEGFGKLNHIIPKGTLDILEKWRRGKYGDK